MTLRPVLLLATSVATGLLLASAPSARADSWRHTDATGDALVTDRFADGSLAEPRTDRTERRADLTKVTVRHTGDTLRIAASVRSREALDQRIAFTIVTSRYTYAVGYYSYAGKGTTLRRNGYVYECTGIVVTPTSAGYLATVPRSCLDGAYRVRVGVQTHAFTGTTPEIYERQIDDDYLRTGRVTERRPKLSPWIVGG